jgi:hypothetical protein
MVAEASPVVEAAAEMAEEASTVISAATRIAQEACPVVRAAAEIVEEASTVVLAAAEIVSEASTVVQAAATIVLNTSYPAAVNGWITSQLASAAAAAVPLGRTASGRGRREDGSGVASGGCCGGLREKEEP